MSRAESNQWSAEQTLSYINGLIAAADDAEDDSTLYTALSIAYEYLINATKRKITWSLSLQKLAYEFIDLAFQTNMHSSIKDIFKSYRAITQGQYSESLKCVLEHYRDSKLQTILDEQIKGDDLPMIRSMPNIENDDPSQEIIIESIDPEKKKKEMQIKNKLKIVWEGYKSIVETVRVNQKLESVYMATLNRIFDFVDRYNRVQEFKTFCRSLRTGLQNAFNKRDRSEQQKAIYIDIEKTDVNNRNIEIRMEQFKVTTKLGLWGQAFLVLEDINTLMRVRRAPLKNSLRCQYFQNLALIFSKNNFWHFHAFAYYNYYVAYLTKPKITPEEKQSLSDRLLLSILVIPTVTIESQQSKEIQQKLAGMMIFSIKVPDRSQLAELMVSKGVLESASASIRQLWNFMFLQFGVSSLKKGLQLAAVIKEEYCNFKQLIEASLINKQLISIAEVYQRIRIQSLERLIPLPLAQIKKMLILAHRQKTIDFTFDQSQGIIVFEDQSQQINPSEEFHNLFMSVSLVCEEGRPVDEVHIRRKVEEYIKTADHDIWSIRMYKINEFKKKMKEPMLELWKKGLLKKKEEEDQREREEAERKAREMEAIQKNEEAQKILATKKIIINDIISIKEQRVVRIMEKKIENLTDQEIQNLTLEVLQQHLEQTKKKIANNKEAKLKKAFNNVDYMERERRHLLDVKVQASMLNQETEKRLRQQFTDTAKKYYHDHSEHRARLQNLAKFYKSKVEEQVKKVQTQFDKETQDYYSRLTDNFKQKVLARAKALLDENNKKKEQQLKQQEALRQASQQYTSKEGKWGFKNPTVVAPVLKKPDPQASTASTPFIKKSNNPFEKLEGVYREETVTKKSEGKWGIGSKLTAQEKKPPEAEEVRQKKQQVSKLEKPKDEKKDQKWAIGSKKVEEKEKVVEKIQQKSEEKKAVFQPPSPAAFQPPPPTTFQPPPPTTFQPPPPATFQPPPTATTEKKGKWGAGDKKEEKKPVQVQVQPEVKKPEVKKGRGW